MPKQVADGLVLQLEDFKTGRDRKINPLVSVNNNPFQNGELLLKLLRIFGIAPGVPVEFIRKERYDVPGLEDVLSDIELAVRINDVNYLTSSRHDANIKGWPRTLGPPAVSELEGPQRYFAPNDPQLRVSVVRP